MDIITNTLVRRALPLFGALATVVLVLALGTILHLAEDVLVPLALATLLSFALAPIVRLLRRAGLGGGLSVFAAVTSALALIVVLGWIAFSQISALTAEIPDHEAQIRAKVERVAGQLRAGGVFTRAAALVSRLVTDLEHPNIPDPANATILPEVVARPVPVSGPTALYRYLEPFLHPLAILFVVLLLSAFMLSERTEVRNRLIRLAGVDDIQQTSAALDDAAQRVGRVLLTQVAVNLSFGLVISVGLWAIGTPSPFLWGLFAGLLRFVPYVGALIGLVPPLVVAFVFDPTWQSVAWTLALFAAVEPLTGHVLEPLLYGHSTGLSPLSILVSITIWTFLWGPIGLVLATPLTVCLVVMGRHIERLQFLHVLLSSEPALALHESFYQRLLSGDPIEVGEQAETFLKTHDLARYYDDVALPALRRAHLDIVRGEIDGERLETLVDSTASLLAALDRRRTRNAFTAARDALATIPAVEVAVLHGDNPLDPAAATMLAQVLRRAGAGVTMRALAALDGDARAEAAGVRVVCFSFIEPLSVLHLRAYSRKAHVCASGAAVMMCIWQEAGSGFADTLQTKLRVADVFTTVTAAAAAVRVALGTPGALRMQAPLQPA